jgi:hypothetical protein
MMKKPVDRKRQKLGSRMRAEYRLDYATARPNRFADRMNNRTIAIVMDPDVAAVFQSSEAVNTFLRSAISILPKRTPKRAKAS